MRKLRMQQPPPTGALLDDVVASATYEIITPMFGGGVNAGGGAGREHLKTPDLVTPVRGAAVRGQLRCWWRLACGRGLAPEVLRARERLLWGAARVDGDEAGRGWVSVSIDAGELGVPRPFAIFEKDHKGRVRAIAGHKGLAYGGFPLQPAKGAADDTPGVLYSFSGTFKVCLRAHPLSQELRGAVSSRWNTSPEDVERILREDVRRAFAAWSTFGGVGGRARRGFGAVAIVDSEGWTCPPVGEVAKTLGRIATRGRHSDATKAHEAALARLQSFRQGKAVGRNPGSQHNRPGRSPWPEPDAIRRLTRRSLPIDEPVLEAGNVFPRAAFGMPIIFHFNHRAEPGDTTLQPQGGARLPSPLILRAIKTSDGRYSAAALVLHDATQHLGELELHEQRNVHRVTGHLAAETARTIGPLREFAGGTDPSSVLLVFLKYFAEG